MPSQCRSRWQLAPIQWRLLGLCLTEKLPKHMFQKCVTERSKLSLRWNMVRRAMELSRIRDTIRSKTLQLVTVCWFVHRRIWRYHHLLHVCDLLNGLPLLVNQGGVILLPDFGVLLQGMLFAMEHFIVATESYIMGRIMVQKHAYQHQ